MQPKQQTCSKLCWNRHFRQGSADTRTRKTAKKLNPVQGDQRWCSACESWKPLGDFTALNGETMRSRCRPCYNAYAREWRDANLDRVRTQQREHRRKRYTLDKFGITRDDYEARRAVSEGCAICGGMPENGKPLHLDHDHATGAVRDFLCENCNRGLGMFQDSPERLRAAAAYLERHRQSDGS